ncbi:serine/threonine-protein kinase [Actinoplanes sp. DH11]|uniref:serine/threonine-protein kinase n=1 Tax=Actinoplanes sp. DH11 TaxID=2857011 RepID=UPI001E57CA63|nr:serine/threonine-protein kinase [Actinoplanes sp. DH11]
MPQPGELLGDRYRLDDRIAAGGMGEVWRATDTVLGRPVAVKTLLAGYAGDAGFRTRFQHEARAMASLRHGGVVPVYDFGETDDGAYLVMARVDGQPLNQRITERGPLSPAETLSIVAQAARALAAAHESGIVHRDVKPGNLIIEPDGTVVLVDFGVARSAGSVTLTGAREVVGTALYIAPEQVSKQTTGPAADIYALGAVAYHCLAGRPPFVGDNPLAVALQHVGEPPPPLPDSVPAPVRDLVMTALAKDPEARFPSAAAMAETAESLLASGAVAGAAPAPAGAADTTALLARTMVAQAPVEPAAPPAATNPPHESAGRRNLVLLSGLLLVLLGSGALIAVADPFGFFSDRTPGTEAPGPVTSPSGRPSPTTGDEPTRGTGNDGNSGTGDKDQQNETEPSRSPRPSQPSTAPAAPSAAPSRTTTEPTTPATTDPTTTTTAPETTGPTGEPDENEPDENENEGDEAGNAAQEP